MTLRLRLAALTTVLLAIVLAASGVVLERFMARDLERSLEKRARDRTRGALPGPGSTARQSTEPPPPGEDPDDPDAPPPPPPPRPEEIPSAPTIVRTLPPEADGATVHVFRYQLPAPGAKGDPVIEARGSSGTLPPPEAEAHRRVAALVEDDAERFVHEGTTWVVALSTPPALDGAGPSRATPPRPRPGMGGGPDAPPPPPPAPRRVAVVAFLDAGPAHDMHRGFVVRIAAIGFCALALGGLLAYALAGRMLRPVATAARAAEEIERPSQRLPAPAAPDELGRLVNVLNGMLARLEAAADRERLFLATASHELRRPLTALLGELELASAEGRSAGDLRGSLALARDDAKAMSRLVDDILHHAKAQAGTLRLVESEVSLGDLVAEAVRRSRRSLAHALEIEVGDVPPLVVRGDTDLLRRALENLVVNAAVHGGEGVHVRIGAERGPDGLSLHVDDDGPGVPAEEVRTIFDPFGRGDRARTVPGFGLGLAISRDVARAHGGDLTVVSPRPGSDEAHPGSRFTLRVAAARVS